MRIVIVGAGAVGSHLAERLSAESQDVVVVEADPVRAVEVQSEIDCMVITGNGASPRVLEQAGIDQADLLIAVSSSDAVNILACHAGARLGVPAKVARIEDPALRAETEILGVDVVIDPGEALARELLLMVRQTGVAEMFEFAGGKLALIGGFIGEDAPLVGKTLAELKVEFALWEWIVVAIVRQGETFIARGDTTIHPGDHVLVMAKRQHLSEVAGLMGLSERSARNVMVLGSTRLAQITVEMLSKAGVTTYIVDQDAERCRRIAESIPECIVVQGDPTDPKVLASEAIDKIDVILALTGWDEVNILGCLVGRALGVETTVARVHRFDLVGLLPAAGIAAGVSARLAAANDILRFVRRGHIRSVATFHDSDAEAIELQVGKGSRAIGSSLADLDIPKGLIVGGISRGKEAFVPTGSTVIAPGDDIIVVASHDAIGEVEELFG